MSDDAMLVVECIFTTIWSIFTSWHFPGTDVTPMAMALFLIIACFGIRFLYVISGASGSLDSVSDAFAAERRNEERAKASKLRESRLRESQRKAMNHAADKVRQRELHNSGYYNDR